MINNNYSNYNTYNTYSKKKKNDSSGVFILLIILGIFFFLIIGSDSGSSSTTNNTIYKESRSTYQPKCTTIEYSKLARNPNMYIGNDYTFTGEVIQVLIGSNNQVDLRVNVTPKRYSYSSETYYEDTMYVIYKYSSSVESRILEGDIITMYGSYQGICTYESIFGQQISIPMLNALYIDIKY